MRGVQLISIILFIGVVAGVWVLQSRMTRQVTEYVGTELSRQQIEIAGDRERAATSIDIETAGLDRLKVVKEAGRESPRDEVLALLNQDLFSEERSIRLSELIDPADWLGNGETLPESPEILELWVKARARRLSDDQCAAIVARFASTCRPRGNTVKPVRDSGLFLIGSSFDFTPTMTFGSPPETETVQFEELSVKKKLNEDLEADAVFSGMMAPQLGQLFELADDACREINLLHGNCGPLNLSARLGVDIRNRIIVNGQDVEEEVEERNASITFEVTIGWLEPPVEVARQ